MRYAGRLRWTWSEVHTHQAKRGSCARSPRTDSDNTRIHRRQGTSNNAMNERDAPNMLPARHGICRAACSSRGTRREHATSPGHIGNSPRMPTRSVGPALRVHTRCASPIYSAVPCASRCLRCLMLARCVACVRAVCGPCGGTRHTSHSMARCGVRRRRRCLLLRVPPKLPPRAVPSACTHATRRAVAAAAPSARLCSRRSSAVGAALGRPRARRQQR